MPPKHKSTADELIEALQDQRVIDAITANIVDKVAAAIEAKFNNKFAELTNNLTDTNVKLEEANEQIKLLQDESVVLTNRLATMERYQRQDDLIIYGIKEGSYAERASGGTTLLNESSDASSPVSSSAATESTFIQFCKDSLDIEVRPSDISIAHRLGRPKTDQSSSPSKPLPIIVRFANKKVRHRILAVRKTLKTAAPGVYVNEHLTPTDGLIAKSARMLVKSKKIFQTFTINGSVMIRKDDAPTTRPIKITSVDQLSRF